MKLAIDRYAHLKSPIHSWQQEYKLIGLLGLVFAFSFVKSLVLLPLIVAISALLFLLSRLPFSYLISRLRYPGWFILAVVILIPFTTGDTIIWQWKWLSLSQEGCRSALLITVRFLCVFTTSIVLFGTAPFLKSIKALQNLGLSKVIVDIALLSYRYLEELGTILSTMQTAIRLRGFNHHKINHSYLQVLASLLGSLFVRSYERSNRIYHAMILRGYGHNREISQQKNDYLISKMPFNRLYLTNFLGLVICLLLSMTILFTDNFVFS